MIAGCSFILHQMEKSLPEMGGIFDQWENLMRSAQR